MRRLSILLLSLILLTSCSNRSLTSDESIRAAYTKEKVTELAKEWIKTKYDKDIEIQSIDELEATQTDETRFQGYALRTKDGGALQFHALSNDTHYFVDSYQEPIYRSIITKEVERLTNGNAKVFFSNDPLPRYFWAEPTEASSPFMLLEQKLSPDMTLEDLEAKDVYVNVLLYHNERDLTELEGLVRSLDKVGIHANVFELLDSVTKEDTKDGLLYEQVARTYKLNGPSFVVHDYLKEEQFGVFSDVPVLMSKGSNVQSFLEASLTEYDPNLLKGAVFALSSKGMVIIDTEKFLSGELTKYKLQIRLAKEGTEVPYYQTGKYIVISAKLPVKTDAPRNNLLFYLTSESK
ncbi:hypothetical protein [Guggenheimella bovis]